MFGYVIIGIHGLSNKPEANLLEKWWSDAILEGLKVNEGFKNIKINFKSVYWADVMYEKPEEEPTPSYTPAKKGAIKQYKDGWKDEIRNVATESAEKIFDFSKKYFGMDFIADEILKAKLNDLSRYYEDIKIKNKLRGLLEKEILNNSDKRIMVIAHSMGSIIAYDVLRELGKKNGKLAVDHFITIGSPLGLPHVIYKIEEESNLLRTPTIVKKWSNFADRRDPVAFDERLKDDYEENDFGIKVIDDLVYNDCDGIGHTAFGYLRTPEISKQIKKFI